MSELESPTAAQTKPPRRRMAPMDRRQDLLAAAITCLAQLGPKGATGREICRQAGVSHGLLRHYFENPETLFLEAYKDLCERFLAEFERLLAANDPDPWRTLDRFFAVLYSETWTGPEVLGAWTAFWTLTRNDPAFAEVNAAHNRGLQDLLAEAVGRLPVKGRDDVDREQVLLIIAALMDGLWLEFSLRPDAAKRAQAVELCNLTLRRLLVA
ncbi:MAG: TetR family transcriptional regulator C-terminal domain-containing protein [Caulobacteraceae bacterium]|nr:TetR family transcriptional regulator C-terminal domain-containing protein [Caulobacteraceae bacterium]